MIDLHAELSTITIKDTQSKISSSTKSSTSNPSESQNSFKSIESDIKQLRHRILNIKQSTMNEQNTRIRNLSKASRNHGHPLCKRICNINTQRKIFTTHCNQRMALFNTNTAIILEKNEKLNRRECINLEKEKLKNTDKIHNFTCTDLTPDFKELLNKGTLSQQWTISTPRLSRKLLLKKLIMPYAHLLENNNLIVTN